MDAPVGPRSAGSTSPDASGELQARGSLTGPDALALTTRRLVTAIRAVRPATLASPSMCFSSPLKTKLWSPNICCERAWSRWAKKISASARPAGAVRPVDSDPAATDAPSGRRCRISDVVDQLLAGQGLAVEAAPRDLGQDDLLAEVVGLADQDAARSGPALRGSATPASPDSRGSGRRSSPPPGSGSSPPGPTCRGSNSRKRSIQIQRIVNRPVSVVSCQWSVVRRAQSDNGQSTTDD